MMWGWLLFAVANAVQSECIESCAVAQLSCGTFATCDGGQEICGLCQSGMSCSGGVCIPDTPADCDRVEMISNTDPDGELYRGCQSMTISGRTCQYWNEQFPHEHNFDPELYSGSGLGDHRYCRNPVNWRTIWCMTSDPEQRWEECAPIGSDEKEDDTMTIGQQREEDRLDRERERQELADAIAEKKDDEERLQETHADMAAGNAKWDTAYGYQTDTADAEYADGEEDTTPFLIGIFLVLFCLIAIFFTTVWCCLQRTKIAPAPSFVVGVAPIGAPASPARKTEKTPRASGARSAYETPRTARGGQAATKTPKATKTPMSSRAANLFRGLVTPRSGRTPRLPFFMKSEANTETGVERDMI